MQNSACPLCYNRGLKRSMKAIQINLEEAVWTCESEDCVWPLMYDQLIFIPRKVGKVWSCYWDQYKPTITKQESIPMPVELSLYTPPETPGENLLLEETKYKIGTIVQDHSYSKTLTDPKEETKENLVKSNDTLDTKVKSDESLTIKTECYKDGQQYEKFNFNLIKEPNDLESLLDEYLSNHQDDLHNPDISDNWLNSLLS